MSRGILDTIRFALWIAFFLSIPLTVIGTGVGLFGGYPSDTTYNYHVKAQQVFDGERVEDHDVTQMENLSAEEQELLYRAFKKTDHFMGSSETTLYYETERLDVFNDWRTVESNGVLLLVAVNEEREQSWDYSEFAWYHWMVHLSSIVTLLGLFRIILLPSA